MKLNKTLSIFLLVHLLVWSVLPIIWRANLPMDSAEALIWGMMGEWGTNKHPPLSGWLADWAFIWGDKNPASLYVLSQVLVVGAIFYIYKIARLFLKRDKALIAAVLMEGVAYYSLVTPEYNCNIVALFLWPACTYHFYQGIKENRLSDWLAFGFFAGLNLLNKYVSGALLLSLGLYLLFTTTGRKCLTSWKLYFSALLGLTLVVPHIIWLYNRDFFVIDYFLGRTGGHNLPYGLGHIVYPLKFLASQIMTSAAALLVLLTAWYHGKEQKATLAQDKKQFIFFAGILPLMIMTAVPLLVGVKLKSMWGSPVLYMLTVIWFAYLPFEVSKIKDKLIVSAYGLLFLFAASFSLQCWFTLSPKFNLDARDFVNSINKKNIQYTGGNVWLASTIGAYHYNNPAVIFDLNFAGNPWINKTDALKQGILVVEENLGAYNAHRAQHPRLEQAKTYRFTAHGAGDKSKEYTIYYGFVSGEK